jgi:hypothetical protein
MSCKSLENKTELVHYYYSNHNITTSSSIGTDPSHLHRHVNFSFPLLNLCNNKQKRPLMDVPRWRKEHIKFGYISLLNKLGKHYSFLFIHRVFCIRGKIQVLC